MSRVLILIALLGLVALVASQPGLGAGTADLTREQLSAQCVEKYSAKYAGRPSKLAKHLAMCKRILTMTDEQFAIKKSTLQTVAVNKAFWSGGVLGAPAGRLYSP